MILPMIAVDPIAGLPLAAPTPAAWLPAATGDLPALLIDHAHCELKAAANAMALAGRHPERSALVRDLTALAREELRHFDQAHAMVRAHGLTLTRPQTDHYVKELHDFVRRRRSAGADGGLIDELVVCGFIESRSCERFRLLSTGPDVPADLKTFYSELAAAEARHHEAELVARLPLGPRIH